MSTEQLLETIFDGVGDEWDMDMSPDWIAMQYVLHLRSEVVRLGGCTRPYCQENDGEVCDHGYSPLEQSTRYMGASSCNVDAEQVTEMMAALHNYAIGDSDPWACAGCGTGIGTCRPYWVGQQKKCCPDCCHLPISENTAEQETT